MATLHASYVSRSNLAGAPYNTFWAADGTAFTRFTSTYTMASVEAPGSPFWYYPSSPATDLSKWIWHDLAPLTDFTLGAIYQNELVDFAVFGTPVALGATVDALVYVMADNAFSIDVQFRRSATTTTTTPVLTLSDNPLPIGTPQPASFPFGWQNVYVFDLRNVFGGAAIGGQDIDIDFRGRVSNYAPAPGAAASNTAGIFFRVDVFSND
ncbi:MAG: hypothetical protein VR69_06070 [Peptococcaceae bacterium BRH_c4b]|nr:MAG: hypothetical protein VR69_06070 [Peptococcaceae bacterium BRH_c4b]